MSDNIFVFDDKEEFAKTMEAWTDHLKEIAINNISLFNEVLSTEAELSIHSPEFLRET